MPITPNPDADFTPSMRGYSGQGAFRFWCQTVLPIVYDDSLSYYELLNKMVIYLNNTISDVANMETNVQSLYDSYVSLQNYVNTYFDNLDVQHEINVKLDEMAESGALDSLIEPFVTEQIGGVVAGQIDNAVAGQIDDTVAEQIGGTVAGQIDNVVAEQIDGSVAGQIDSAVAGQIDATVAEQIDESVAEQIATPAATATTAWLVANVNPVGSAVVVDSSLSISGAAADAKVTGDGIYTTRDNIFDTIIGFGDNLFNKNKVSNGYIDQTTGSFVADARYKTSDFIPVLNSGNYILNINAAFNLGNVAGILYCYGIDKKYVKQYAGTPIYESTSNPWYSFTNIDLTGIYYVRFTNGSTSLNNVFFGNTDTVPADVPDYMPVINDEIKMNYEQLLNKPNLLQMDTSLRDNTKAANAKITGDAIAFNRNKILNDIIDYSENLFNKNDAVNGYIDSYSHNLVIDNNYRTSNFIPVFESGNYILNINAVYNLGDSAGILYCYDIAGKYVKSYTGTKLSESTSNPWFGYSNIDLTGICYIRFTNGNTSLNNVFFGKGTTILATIPAYHPVINENVTIDYAQVKNAPIIKNYEYDSELTGKTWYLIGDSATHGDFTGITTPTFESGIYQGEMKVYPFYIGNRTGMVIHNLAVNGATMATISGHPEIYQWSANDHYMTVGADADFITIWIGANDMWQNVPIGTIGSNDSSTFYGAYNTVLEYYVNNFPNTKLGLVASFWCTEAYANAIIALGAKYGVPVLNLYNECSG